MRTLHLFAGCGGGLLSDLILGHTPVGAIEWDASCCQVLRERKEDGWFPELNVHECDIRDFDFSSYRGRVDQIAAGFPCTDISCAGKGAGITGSQSGLVSEVWRAVDVIRPPFIFLENSPQIRTRGRREIITELVARGYSWRDGTLAVSDVGAGHIRKRWWCLAANVDGLRELERKRGECSERGWDSYILEDVADSLRQGLQEFWWDATNGQGAKPSSRGNETSPTDSNGIHGDMGRLCPGEVSLIEAAGVRGSEEDAPDSDNQRRDGRAGDEPQTQRGDESTNHAPDSLLNRLEIAIQQGRIRQAEADAIQAAAGYTGAYGWNWPQTECGLRGMVDGISDPLDGNTKGNRIKALGNAQVPLQAAVAWMMLANGKEETE